MLHDDDVIAKHGGQVADDRVLTKGFTLWMRERVTRGQEPVT